MKSAKEYKNLQRTLDKIYNRAYELGWTWTQLANNAGIHYSTVYKLGHYQTMFSRTQTVMMLAEAVGYRMILS